jgi:hypothetical protein
MKKILIGILLFVAVAAVAGYVASPYLAFYHLQRVARAGDRDGLAEAVDFPSVREGFKAQIDAALMAKFQSRPDLRNNPLAVLGMLLAPAVAGRLIDAYVTPQSIAEMVADARTPKPGTSPPQRDGNRPRVTWHSEYVSLDRFRASVSSADRPDQPLTFVLARRGLFAWKLIEIDLPPEALGQ